MWFCSLIHVLFSDPFSFLCKAWYKNDVRRMNGSLSCLKACKHHLQGVLLTVKNDVSIIHGVPPDREDVAWTWRL